MRRGFFMARKRVILPKRLSRPTICLMRRLAAWLFSAALFALLSAPALLSGPARAAEGEALDVLFDKLYETENPIEARQIERKIWEAWSHSGSDTIDSLLASGTQVMNDGDYSRAAAIFSEMIDLKPDFAEAYNKRATTYFLAGRYAASVADVERALKLEPRHFGALSGLGLMMERLDNLPEAIRAYRRALAANPHMPDLPERLKDLRRKQDAREL